MKTIIFAILLMLGLAIGVSGWELPPATSGYVCNPASGEYQSAGNVNVTGTADHATRVYVSGKTSSKLTFGSWQIPCSSWYTPVALSNDFDTWWQGVANVYITEAANYNFSLAGTGLAEQPNGASWSLGGEVPPLFGLPQLTQKGDDYPYADGKRTFSQRACCLLSILAGGKKINRCPWTGHQFNDYLKLAKGFNVRDVRCPVAAKLLGMTYIGEFKYTTANLQKYSARGWHMVPKVGVYHWSKKKGTYYTTHFIAKAPGVTLKSDKAVISVMDSMLRTNYLPYNKYAIRSIKVFAPTVPVDSASLWSIPYFWTKMGWWKKPIPYPPVWEPFYTAMNYPSDTTGLGSYVTCGLSRVDANSSVGAFIESVDTPTYQLTKSNSEEVCAYATLADDINDPDHNDEDPLDETADPSVVPQNDMSVAEIGEAQKGSYTFHLTGLAGSTWTLIISPTNDIGDPMDEITLSGTFDETGKASTTYVFDPGVIVYQLGSMRKMAVGSTVAFSMEVTAANNDAFFVESADRSSGVRVISTSNPTVGSKVIVQGTLVQASPEITVRATSVTQTSLGEPTIKPLGMAGKWPEMANCLLAKICGKVVSKDTTAMTITNGTTEIVISGADTAPAIGDFISAIGILRTGNVLELKSGSITVIE